MVKLWAEKEVRNLKRIHQSGIPAPYPYILKNNIIVMDFIGEKGGAAAKRLRDADIADQPAVYIEVVNIMRQLFQQCKLVHADLSEYNLLWHQDKVWVIDVSQGVEHDHPMALDFLRRDCHNINEYFERSHKVTTLSTQQLFQFIT